MNRLIREAFTDFLMGMFIFLLLVLHCTQTRGAMYSFDTANTDLRSAIATSTNIANLTNQITIMLWHTQAPSDPVLGRGYFSRGTSLIGLQDSGNSKVDFVYTDSVATEHLFRSTPNYKDTNVLKHLAFTIQYGTGSSAKLYRNGTNMGGAWAAGTGNTLPFNTPNFMTIGGSRNAGDQRQIGYYSEVAIWSNILSEFQINLIYKSRMKGIVKQINPRALMMYIPLDGFPDTVPINVTNSMRDRVLYGNVHFSPPTTGVSKPNGMCERVCSYQPNE